MIIAIANQKGGVGKTTTAINVAAGLAHRNLRTLVIDLDPQANTSMTFADRERGGPTMFEVLTGTSSLADAIQPSPAAEGLWVAPSRISMAKVEVSLVGELDAPYRLKDRLAPEADGFDAVVIDTPPALGLITLNALVAATHVLVPIQASYFALEGTDDLLETIDKIKSRPNPDLRLLGVLVTMYDKRTILSRQVVDEIDGVFGPLVFDTRITKSVRLEESPAHRTSIFQHAPESSGAAEYYGLCEEVLQRVGS